MGYIANMMARLGLENSDFNTGMDKSTRAVNSFGQNVESAGRRLTMGLALPLVGFGVVAVKAAADMQSLTMGLTAITKNSGETERQLVRLREVAKLPGLGFAEAVQGSINLQAAGFSAQLAERSLKAFGNALATVGKGRADLDGVNLVLTQIVNKPKVMAQDLNQLRERLPQISQLMKAAFGSSVSEDIQALGITGQQFVERVITELEKMPKVTGGIKNDFENLQDSIKISLADAGNALLPFAAKMATFAADIAAKLSDIAKGFQALPGWVQNSTVAFGGLLVALPLVTVALGATITNAIAIGGAFSKLIPLITTARLAMLGIPGVIAAVGVAAWAAGDHLQKKFAPGVDTSRDALENLKKTMYGAAPKDAGVMDAVIGHLGTLDDKTKKLGDAAKETAPKVEELKKHLYSIPFEEKARENMVLVERIRLLESSIHATAVEIAKSGKSITDFFTDLKAASEKGIQDAMDMTPPDITPELETGAIEKVLDAASKKTKEVKKETKEARNEISEFERQVERTFSRMARGIADSIVQWKGFGSALKSIAQDTAAGFLEIMIRVLIKPLEDQFAKLAGKLASALGIGTSAASGAASGVGAAAGGAASGAGSVASGAIGVASKGLAGIVSAVSSSISAVFAGLSFFQGRRMEQDIGRIEVSTRYASIALNGADGVADNLKRIRDGIYNVRDLLAGGVNLSNGKPPNVNSGLQVNFYGPVNGSPTEIANAIFQQAALAGMA